MVIVCVTLTYFIFNI